jgi:MATE family multidrug resistance protein
VISLRAELRALLVLAAPLFVTHFGSLLLGLVDIAVVGRLGEAPIAAVGLGQTVFFATSVLGFGWMLALDPLIAQAIGAGEPKRAEDLLAQGMWMAVIASVPLSIALLCIGENLELLGIERATAVHARPYLFARLPGLFPFLCLAGARSYLSARTRTMPLVVGVVLANIVNIALAYPLVFGSIGIPALGTAGAGIAAACATFVQLAVALVAVRVLTSPDRSLRPFGRADRALMWKTIVLGTPIGLTLLAEVGSFLIVTLLMGNIGTRALASHSVAVTLISATFQCALAMGAAAAMRVGNAVGQQDRVSARRSGLLAIGTIATFMGGCAILFLVIPEPLARIVTDEPHVIAAAIPLLAVAAAFQIFDGAQAVAAGALRGAGDTRWPLLLNLIGHYAIGIPVGAALAFGLGWGAVGLWWGLSAGLTTVAIALTKRFFDLSKHTIERA